MAQVTLPKTNQTGTNEWADVEDNDIALRDALNGGLDNTNVTAAAAIALSKLAAGTSAQIIVANGSGVPTYVALSGDATVATTGALTLAANSVATAEITNANVTGPKLADDVVGVYRTVASAGASLDTDAVAATYFVEQGEPSPWSLPAGNPQPNNLAFYLDDADYTVAGRTTKLRLRAQVAANATAATITFTFGLYPITVAGAADTLTYTLGTVVSGSTAVVTDPAASTVTSGVGSDFNVPADGTYALGVVTNATLANNAARSFHAQIQMRHV